jgi:hypothetical protein
MPHVTLSIPEEIYKEMKRYPEIKWSEIIRRSVASYLEEMKASSSSTEIRSMLDENTLNRLRSISSKKADWYFEKSEKAAWKRARSLTQTS